MVIRLRKPPAVPLPDPPIAVETLRALVGKDPTFMLHRRVAAPEPQWSALDRIVKEGTKA